MYVANVKSTALEIAGNTQPLEGVLGFMVERAARTFRHLGGLEFEQDFLDVGRIRIVRCQQPRLEKIRRCDSASRRFEPRRYSRGSRRLGHRFTNLLPQPFRVQAFGGQSRPRAGDLNPPSNLQLVSSERHSTDRNAARKCF